MADGLNPQQMKFKEAYLNPNSATFSNAYRSALLADYSEEYAKNITSKGGDWISELIGDREMLGKAEKVLDKTLDLPTQFTKDGNIESSIEKVRLDAAKFVAETLGKSKYAKRNEHTGPDGKELPTPIIALNEIPRDNSDAEG